MLSTWVLVVMGLGTAFAGTVGGIGGATLLIPLLLLAGLDPLEAAPLGLISVAATSLAASVRQLDDGLVHHRLGLSVEVFASTGAVFGAVVSTSLGSQWPARALGLGALAGAVATLTRRGGGHDSEPVFFDDSPGEWPGTLGGTYHHGELSVPYHARRVPQGLGVSALAGVIAGMAGVGGGFLKTPAMSEVMRVPVKVAAATSTFTMGLTAAAGLIVMAGQGRIEAVPSTSVVIGAVVGATLGAITQGRLPAARARLVTGGLLLSVAVVVLVRAG